MNFQLETLCKNKKISCLKLEKILGIPNAKLNKYYRKAGYPNVERAVIIANHFNCSLDFLTGLTNLKKDRELTAPNIELFHLRLKNLILLEHSQSAFFEKCKIARSNLYRWLCKNDFPKLANLFIVAENLNVSLDYLIGRTNKKEI